jgi:hypothetical protein
MQGIYLLAEQLFASQVGFCSVQLVGCEVRSRCSRQNFVFKYPQIEFFTYSEGASFAPI